MKLVKRNFRCDRFLVNTYFIDTTIVIAMDYFSLCTLCNVSSPSEISSGGSHCLVNAASLLPLFLYSRGGSIRKSSSSSCSTPYTGKPEREREKQEREMFGGLVSQIKNLINGWSLYRTNGIVGCRHCRYRSIIA